MMTVYLTLKYIHLTSVATTLVLFVGRGLWMLSSSHYLQRRWAYIVPPIIDTVLLASAIGLMLVLHQYPFINDWLTAKILALIGYIVFGSIALKYGRTRLIRIGAGCIALILFVYMVWVAHSKTPFPWLL